MSENKLCVHFGSCGGCETQNIPYGQQLADKEALIRRIVAPFAPKQFLPIKSSPDAFYYRNKVEFAFGLNEGRVAIGLRQKNRFDQIVDLTECLIHSPDAPQLLEAVKRWAEAEKLAPYNLHSHQGFLRYLAIREGKHTGQRLIHLVTGSGDLPRESFVRALDESGSRVDTVVWSTNHEMSDVARGASSVVLKGSGVIEETLDGLPFRISATAFFQTNTRGAEVLYKTIREFVNQTETLIDFYCGSGTIGLFCAKNAKRILGVEVHGPAVTDARANAQRQGVEHAEFFAMDAGTFAQRTDLMEVWAKPGAVAVMDPPRPGLQRQVRQLLMAQPVERWVYVSCNPKAMAMDLPILVDRYAIEAVQPVDMFPHTPHVETVLLLKRKS